MGRGLHATDRRVKNPHGPDAAEFGGSLAVRKLCRHKPDPRRVAPGSWNGLWHYPSSACRPVALPTGDCRQCIGGASARPFPSPPRSRTHGQRGHRQGKRRGVCPRDGDLARRTPREVHAANRSSRPEGRRPARRPCRQWTFAPHHAILLGSFCQSFAAGGYDTRGHHPWVRHSQRPRCHRILALSRITEPRLPDSDHSWLASMLCDPPTSGRSRPESVRCPAESSPRSMAGG